MPAWYPSLYPKVPLEPERDFRPIPGVWHAYGVTVRVSADHPGGTFSIQIQFVSVSVNPCLKISGQWVRALRQRF